MGFIETLETWGGKVLDVARMDLLKHTYKLQVDKISETAAEASSIIPSPFTSARGYVDGHPASCSVTRHANLRVAVAEEHVANRDGAGGIGEEKPVSVVATDVHVKDRAEANDRDADTGPEIQVACAAIIDVVPPDKKKHIAVLCGSHRGNQVARPYHRKAPRRPRQHRSQHQ